MCVSICEYLYGLTAVVDQGLPVDEVPRSHSQTPQSIGIPWTSDRTVANTSTWQHTTISRDIHAPGGIRTYNPSKWVAADTCRRPCSHWDRHRYLRMKEWAIWNNRTVFPFSLTLWSRNYFF